MGYLENIAVLPEYRSQGVAQQLIKLCEEFAFLQGWRKIALVVRIDNLPAISLYTKVGFVLIPESFHTVQNGLVEVMSMVKHLGE